MRVELHPDARAELRSAAIWYDEHRDGLGSDFIAEVAAAFERISDGADSYPAWPGIGARTPRIQRHTLQRFPYVIAFEQRQNHVLVLAIAHAKRRPLYWLRRSSP